MIENPMPRSEYFEIVAKSALNRVQHMGFKWSLNPYQGCFHSCVYCFARAHAKLADRDPGVGFSARIGVKVNLPEVLRHELASRSWKRDTVAFGTATDPYQPIEGHYRLTRRSIEALVRARTPIGLITKGPMIVRDKDVLLELTKAASCTVNMSVPTVDEDAWRTLEPGTAHPLQRLRAVRELTDAGINAGVLMAPIVPGFSSSRAKLERTVKAIADHGARFVGCNVMYLEDGTRTHFMKFIEREFPAMTPRFDRLYAKKYPPDSYRKEVGAMVRVLQDRYGLTKRERIDTPAAPETATEPEQVGFKW
jgi:DNA repair photolyase